MRNEGKRIDFWIDPVTTKPPRERGFQNYENVVLFPRTHTRHRTRNNCLLVFFAKESRLGSTKACICQSHRRISEGLAPGNHSSTDSDPNKTAGH